jgi:hypothetical protein
MSDQKENWFKSPEKWHCSLCQAWEGRLTPCPRIFLPSWEGNSVLLLLDVNHWMHCTINSSCRVLSRSLCQCFPAARHRWFSFRSEQRMTLYSWNSKAGSMSWWDFSSTAVHGSHATKYIVVSICYQWGISFWKKNSVRYNLTVLAGYCCFGVSGRQYISVVDWLRCRWRKKAQECWCWKEPQVKKGLHFSDDN